MHWQKNLARLATSTLLALWLGSAAPAAGLAYVTCQNGDGVSVIDLAQMAQVSRWSVPGKPAGVAVSTQAVFTVSPDAKTVRRHDPVSGAVQATATLDGGPIGIVHDAKRSRLFVSDWYNARVWVLSDDDLTQTHALETGAAPAGLALSPNGRFVASADRDANQVSIFNADSLSLHARLNVGERPFGLHFAPDGRLFVGNVGSDDVSVIAADGTHVADQFEVGARPYGVAFAKGRAFVTNQYADSISVVALDTLEPVETLESGEYPEGINATPDGENIVVANWFENTITIFDAETLSVLGSVETCDGPRAFGVFISGGK